MGHYREESLQEGVHLWFNSLIEPESSNSFDVVDFVLITDQNVLAIGNQFYFSLSAKVIQRFNKVLTDVLDIIIFQEPIHRFKETTVIVFNIGLVQWHTQHHLIEGLHKEAVD